jgi:stage II sporulation protein D
VTGRRRTTAPSRPKGLLLLFLILIVALAGVPLREAVNAQAEVTDTDLERASGGRIVTIGELAAGRVTRLPLEVYVARVLANEGDPKAAPAAQEALAVAIRTFAIVNAGRHRRDGYDLCDTTHCQTLRNSTAATRQVVLATAGQILTWEGRPAEVFYSTSCGGQSEAASEVWPGAAYPYLQSVRDDVHDEDVPWTLDLTLRDVERALRQAGFDGRLTRIAVETRTVSGRVGRLRLSGMEPAVIAGDQFRRAVGVATVRSTAFDLTTTSSGIHLVGRGYGHGVGMCVIGAGRRAARGESSRAILATYFPQLVVARLDGAPSGAPPSLSTVPAPAAAAPAGRAGAPAARATVPPRGDGVTVQGIEDPTMVAEVARLTATARNDLSRALRVPARPLTIELHETLDDFRLSTGQPWWVQAVADGSTVDLAPLPLLDQRDGVETAVRIGVAQLLVSEALAGRPAWVRVGAARYYARGASAAPASRRTRCPSDAELTLALSAAAQREAESRAEACFARAIAARGDWRAVR